MRILIIVVVGILTAFSALAKEVQPTIYDDGRSCPESCDAHVVFHNSMNGTKHAHLPGTKNDKCVQGQNCEVCFDHKRKQCATTIYRGGGPPKHKFDFTKAYYLENCDDDELPVALEKMCASLERKSRELDERVNCIKNPEHDLCVSTMKSALSLKKSDTSRYFECNRIGQENYNKGKAPSEQRSIGCAYEKEKNGGPNSNGKRWHKLLPGACREDDFVGKYGLDCCSGNSFIDASLSGCMEFYPKP